MCPITGTDISVSFPCCTAVWARYEETPRTGFKFIVADPPPNRGPRNRCPEDPAVLAEERKLRAEAREGDWLSEDDVAAGLFDGEGECSGAGNDTA